MPAKPKKKPKITVKESKLIKGVAEGKTQIQAAKDAGYTGSDAVISTTASETLKKPKIQEALQLAFEKHDITMDRIMGVVDDALDAEKDSFYDEHGNKRGGGKDHSTRLRAANFAADLMDAKPKRDGGGGVTFVFNQNGQSSRFVKNNQEEVLDGQSQTDQEASET